MTPPAQQQTPRDRPTLSVITVFHQNRAVARDYVRAWEIDAAAAAPQIEWLFGDSGSDDGTRELLQRASRSGRFEVDAFSENVGFARGNNRLARRARGEVLVFLNYDVGFTRGWLDELVRPFAGRPGLGITGNVQLSVRSQAPDHAGIYFQEHGAPFHFRPALEHLARLDLLPVPAVTGACLAIRRDLFEKIGGFHEGYRNSYEDIELCLRARELGFEVAVATRSIIWHYIGASPGRQERESANAALFQQRYGAFARALSRFAPPELASNTRTHHAIAHPTRDSETLQVFYDRGSGYSEGESTVHLLRRGRWNRVEIAISHDSGMPPRSIRLDPGRSAGRIRFGGMALKRDRARVCIGFVRGRRLQQAAAVSGTAHPVEDADALSIESTGTDPQVAFELADLFPSMPAGAFLEVWLWVDLPRIEAARAPAPGRTPGSFSLRLKRRRVLVDLMRLSPGGLNGGVKVLVLELLEAVARRNRFRLSLHVLAIPEVCREITASAPRLDCHAVTPEHSAEAALEAVRPDVLYAPLGFSNLSRPSLPQASLLVDFLHRDIAQALPDMEIAAREKWMVETLSRSDVLQCNSQFVVDRLRHHYGTPAASVLVVYNAVGQSTRFASKSHPGTPYFFYPANDWPHKNHTRLLEAYAAYRSTQSTPWDLKLSGHFADPARITATIERLGLIACTEVLGHLPERDFNRVFSQAGALVFVSRYEGFGIPVLEAFRLEVPVLCSRAASLPEVGGEACGYFDPDTVKSIADAMTRLANDAAWRSALVAAGRRRARDFSLPLEADKLGRTFLDLARR